MSTAVQPAVSSLELELTGLCQASCTHCLASSGPTGTHGSMTAADWRRVINQAADAGVSTIQFIGGEPLLYRELPELIRHTLGHGLNIEVYSNLIHVRHALWGVLKLPRVSLGTSYYSDTAEEHEKITKVRGSYKRTRNNIATALTKGIPLRAGIVHVLPEQRVDQAEAELRAMGVDRITTDRSRPFGRAAAGATPDLSQLCGNCTRGRGAILPNGDVVGCVLSRDWPTGNVHEQPLADVLTGPRWEDLSRRIPMPSMAACTPADSSDCNPANTTACSPKY
jgi:MoaA/NifB/PqqE/SkfB family radical SAM enzyme